MWYNGTWFSMKNYGTMVDYQKVRNFDYIGTDYGNIPN